MGALMVRSLALVLAMASLGAAQNARVEGAALVDEGRRLYRELDFAGCVDAMNRALDLPGAGDAVRLEAYEYLGSAYVVLDREPDAEEAFRAMIDIDPYHIVREPSGSPKIEEFVETLRRQLVSDAALDRSLSLSTELPRASRVGLSTNVRVDVDGPAERVSMVTLYVRADDETEWHAVVLRGAGGSFEGTIPARRVAGELELYVEARDAAGRVVTRGAEPFRPLTLRIRERERGPSEEEPLRRKWWLWTIVGVVLVGLAVGVGVAVSDPERAGAGTLPPGRVELP
ncbi:MAG: hypothetical protein AAGE52_07845 [Myxococcota bacterium]